MDKNITRHPGHYIREHILPKGMSVAQAAKKLGVGRPALSNMLNGKAALSPGMATRIERVFGENARTLVDMQTAYEADIAKNRITAATTKPYVPPFLQIKANHIEDWAGDLAARSKLAVFLRTLVNSTGDKLTKVEFPGNDDSERPGWDGCVEAGEANPWIPEGKSGWEFSVCQNPKTKAGKDYAKSVKQSSADERKETTFIFVTPRRWPHKNSWEKERRKEKKWKDVRVYDANNLEEWLEQSIPAQIWFAGESKTDISLDGVRLLEACWEKWKADCKPELSPELFVPAIKELQSSAKEKLLNPSGSPLTISADSAQEAFAFLYCLFLKDNTGLSHLRDSIVVFDKPEQLAKLVSKSPNFIFVTSSRQVERELAQHVKNLRSIIVYPRNAANIAPDITLETLNYESFSGALKAMGCDGDKIDSLARESGKSLTVLRRRLSNIAAVQTPDWASDRLVAKSLIPFLFAGAWEIKNNADEAIMELLSDQWSYKELEGQFAALRQFEDALVWSAGSYCGLVSKIDVLFAISKDITESDIQRFLKVARLVLSEDDPSLDLPEDQRWAAVFYGKKRAVSSTLKDGICETLILLSVHGNQLFKERLNIDLEIETGRLIKKLLTPLTVRTLETQSENFPMYAEAAPEAFLDILEKDLESDMPLLFSLMRPVSDALFGRCYRTELLWALESLAWFEKYLSRVVLVLGRLSQQNINDNWVNRPENSLNSIFQYWMPQTSVDIEKRIAAFELLAKEFPDVAWRIGIEQFYDGLRIGDYSYKPRWRTDGRGHGEPVTCEEKNKFVFHVLNMAIDWKHHNRQTLTDLVQGVRRCDKKDQNKIWDLIEQWSKNAPEEDKSWVREKIRVIAFTRHATRQKQKGHRKKINSNRARQVYELLAPSDVILKHEWLFLNHWVEEPIEEIEEEEMNLDERGERIANMRQAALKEILQHRGKHGLIEIAERGKAAYVIGRLVTKIYKTSKDLIDIIRFVLDYGSFADENSHRFLICGILRSLPDDRAKKTLPELIENLQEDELVPVFVLCPFSRLTWKELGKLDEETQKKYWQNVQPDIGARNTGDDLKYAVDKLIEVRRPRSAFSLIRFCMDKIQPKQLMELLFATGNREKDSESVDMHNLEPYTIRKALETLSGSGEIDISDLSALEFKYIDVFDMKDGKIPNLEIQIERHPELYVHTIAFAYKRSDGGDDPEELEAMNENHKKIRSINSYKVLEKLARFHGHDKDGKQNSSEIVNWVRQVRAGCKKLARERACDHVLGKLFSTAFKEDEEVWLNEHVRDALEQVINEEMSISLKTALYNKRGVHTRGKGGDQERRIAERFRKQVDALQYTHPKIARVLNKLVETYEHEAEWHDAEDAVRKRLWNW